VQDELKKKGLPWEKAKAWDNSAVVGKWVDIQPDLKKGDMRFRLDKNKETVQQGHTADMIFSFDQIVSNISNYFSLNIGDMVFTGTPAGVGECVVGDEFEGYIGDELLFELAVK
jgi:2-keto-4-pentenoate hydratase/2-oxohepta-3-ene-1,7-dioic acid hydratase in catechol pathway